MNPQAIWIPAQARRSWICSMNFIEAGNTIVLITHDDQVADEAERKICIRDGKVSEVRI